MNELTSLAPQEIDDWANDPSGPVALHVKQRVQPVEVGGKIIYPPTYADIGYNIDTLPDGTRVALIDSVGSQANRMEPVFKHEPYADLVPQIYVELHDKTDSDGTQIEKRSLLDLAHRGADAVVHACPTLSPTLEKAFRALKQRGDSGPLCRVAPTSLVFGVWDSRGGSGEKRPRLVRSVIRAWDVQILHSAAQFNSVWKALDEDQKAELKKEERKKGKKKLSAVGFADAPAVFRNVSRSAESGGVREFVNSSPNPDRRVLGGIYVNGSIERDITVNLVALRAIKGADEQETQAIRRYLLALTLIAATADIDLFLREGCHLGFADDEQWHAIPRRGKPVPVDLTSCSAGKALLADASKAVEPFKDDWPSDLTHKFDLKAAKQLMARTENDEDG